MTALAGCRARFRCCGARDGGGASCLRYCTGPRRTGPLSGAEIESVTNPERRPFVSPESGVQRLGMAPEGPSHARRAYRESAASLAGGEARRLVSKESRFCPAEVDAGVPPFPRAHPGSSWGSGIRQAGVGP